MQHPVRWAKTVLLLAVAIFAPVHGLAQDSGDQYGGARAAFAGMQRVSGEVTAINGAKFTVKSAEGETVQVVTTDNTRIMKGRGGSGTAVKLTDLKVGDGVMAAGNLDAPNKTLHAAILFATDAAEVKRLRDELGKSYIVGKVTAIDLDDAKMTVERPDKVSQTIGFDETTSFRRGGRAQFGQSQSSATTGKTPQVTGGESITLADIKVGDNVRGTGTLKSGVFVPTQLIVMVKRSGTAPEAKP
jgi:predicted RNA-binding protein